MLDRLESLSRILCYVLGALLCLELVNAVIRGDPLRHTKIPELPALDAAATNSAPANSLKKISGITNASGTNGIGTNTVKTNSVKAIVTSTNGGKTNFAKLSNATTNSTGTNLIPADFDKTNSAPVGRTGRHRRMTGPMMMMGMGMGMGKKVDLPAPVQARVDAIVQSEILGPFMRPLPMALLGIAGDDAFLRSPDGQTGMIKEGADLGGIKLLRIGINRVLVEENGEKKELTLFEGSGGESLLPPQTNTAIPTVKTNVQATKKETH